MKIFLPGIALESYSLCKKVCIPARRRSQVEFETLNDCSECIARH